MPMDVLGHALLWGSALSAWLTVAFVSLSAINPEMWLHDYPPDIRAKHGPMSPAANRQRWLLGAPVMAVALGIVIVATVRLVDGRPGTVGFGPVFLHTCVVLMVFNVVDLLVIDWLLFVRLRPRFVILPGTEGLAGYDDYAFHWTAFLKGSAGIVVVSVIAASVVSVLA
jgi:hypothetical protein